MQQCEDELRDALSGWERQRRLVEEAETAAAAQRETIESRDRTATGLREEIEALKKEDVDLRQAIAEQREDPESRDHTILGLREETHQLRDRLDEAFRARNLNRYVNFISIYLSRRFLLLGFLVFMTPILLQSSCVFGLPHHQSRSV